MAQVDDVYSHLLATIIHDGYSLPPAERQNVGTKQINSYNFQVDLREEFPLLTTKKMFTKGIIVELLWFLDGDTNIKYLVDNGVNIWNGDAYKYYIKLCNQTGLITGNKAEWHPISIERFLKNVKDNRVSKWIPNYIYGDLGPVYGKQWRNWEGRRYYAGVDRTGEDDYEVDSVDQIFKLITDIKYAIANNYNNRRLIVNAWNVGQIEEMALPPCHKDFQVILEPITPLAPMTDAYDLPKYYLNLIWNQRSVDTFLGLPFNIASYAFLAHMLAQQTNTIPKDLIGELRNVHLYDSHIELAKQQCERNPLPGCSLKLEKKSSIFDYKLEDFKIEGYQSYGALKGEIVT